MLGEFFAARAEDIDDGLVEDGPYGRLRLVEAKGLTPVSLATLGEILGAGTYDQLVEPISEGPAAESEEAGLLTIPTGFRDALAEAKDIEVVAERWAATEELSRDGWSAEESREMLGELSALAPRRRPRKPRALVLVVALTTSGSVACRHRFGGPGSAQRGVNRSPSKRLT